MRRRTVLSWLQNIESESKPSYPPNLLYSEGFTMTPPESRSAQQSGSPRKRKRISTSIIDMDENNENEATRRKKACNRKVNDQNSIYSSELSSCSITSLTAATRLSQPQTQSQTGPLTSRSTSPTKRLLIELRGARPSIHWKQPEGTNMPPAVADLHLTLVRGFG